MSVLFRLIFFVSIVTLSGCTVSDATSSSSAPAPASPAGPVQINGIANFQQTALVLTDSCRAVKYETDRRTAARAAIDSALERYAASLPGGLTVDIQSMSLRMRCHYSGLSNFESYCMANAILQMTATGRDRTGEIKLSSTKDVSERADHALLCINAMPAATAAVDKALAEALAELQGSLTARTGISTR
jgi:hypothetical protein